jgi:hypothetical protein
MEEMAEPLTAGLQARGRAALVDTGVPGGPIMVTAVTGEVGAQGREMPMGETAAVEDPAGGRVAREETGAAEDAEAAQAVAAALEV